MCSQRSNVATLALLLASSFALLAAQEGRTTARNSGRATPADARLLSWQEHVALDRSSLFAQMRWRRVGPSFQGGRIQSITLDPRHPGRIYLGVGSGNVWRTDNNGVTWTPIFEHESTFTVGDVALSPADSNVIWVGSGEVLMARSSFAGSGVFKSIDGGRTWRNMGLADTHHIGKVLVDPKNADTVYVAAIGHNFSANAERGLFKTTDGGKTWSKVLYLSEHTGVVDVLMDPHDNRTLWAVAWQRGRTAWNNVVDGPESGVYKTSDAGETWKKVAGGLPTGEHVGRMGLAMSPTRPDVMYALADNRTPVAKDTRDNRQGEPAIAGGELYRSDDRGATWRKMNTGPIGTAIGYDFCLVRVSPENPDEIYILGNYLKRSRDGGRTYETLDGRDRIVHLRPHGGKMLHLDHHAMVIDPANANRLLLGSDGGLYISDDRGSTWLHLNNLPIGEFYAVSADNRDPYRIYGGTQDDGALYGTAEAIRDDEPESWQHVYLDPWTGGDSYYTLADPVNSDLVYFEHQFGDIRRKNVRTGATKSIQPVAAPGEAPLRYNWMTPFAISTYNPFTLYYAANRVYKSVDRGDHWVAISPDLTTNPGPDRRGNVPFGTMTTLAESPLTPGLLVVGTDDGRVQVTTDEGRTWRDASAGLPGKWVSRVAASSFDPALLYVSLTGYREDDFEKYLFVSRDLGRTWTSIAGNLPSEPINVVREDPVNPDLLYVGTDLGVYVSLDRGKTWQSLRGDLPTCAVHDLVVHPRDHELIAATHGRSIFVLDARPLEALSEEVRAKPLHVFDVRPVTLPAHAEDDEPVPQRAGHYARIHFYLQSQAPVSLTVRDAEGRIIRTMDAMGEAGVNELRWDLKGLPPKAKAGAEPRFRDVGPGIYRAEIASGNQRAAQVDVVVHPFGWHPTT